MFRLSLSPRVAKSSFLIRNRIILKEEKARVFQPDLVFRELLEEGHQLKPWSKTDRIYVAGSETLVGKGLLRQLDLAGYSNVVDTSSVEPDLTDGSERRCLFRSHEAGLCLSGGRKVGRYWSQSKVSRRPHAQ